MVLARHLSTMLTAAYRFVVIIDGKPLAAFTECTLPDIELEVETVKEGGLNSYVHQLPGPRKSAKITLKNGVGVSMHLVSLYLKAMNEPSSRLHLNIALLNPLFVPVMVLDIADAYPVKWTGPQLTADGNTIAIQTMEFVCGEVTVA